MNTNSKRSRRLSTLLARVFVLAPAILWTNAVKAENPLPALRLGALIHLTGEYAMQGSAFQEGIEVAQKEINGSGGVSGRKLEIAYEDTAYNMKQVHSGAVKFTALDKVLAAIVTNYTEVMVAGPVFERAKIPLVTLWDSAPEIEALGDYVFGIGTWTPSTTDTAVQYAREQLKAKRAVGVATVGQWSLTTTEDFGKKFAASGGTFLELLSQNPGDADFRSLFVKIRSLRPDVIYAPVADNIPAFFEQYRKSGLTVPVVTSDVLNEAIIRENPAIYEGVYQTQSANPESSGARQFQEQCLEHLGRKCSQLLLSAWGYDAVHLYAEAIRVVGPDSEKIKTHLYGVKGYQGASSTITINPEGSFRSLVSMFRIQHGVLRKVT